MCRRSEQVVTREPLTTGRKRKPTFPRPLSDSEQIPAIAVWQNDGGCHKNIVRHFPGRFYPLSLVRLESI
jgi:hypothetical protein